MSGGEPDIHEWSSAPLQLHAEDAVAEQRGLLLQPTAKNRGIGTVDGHGSESGGMECTRIESVLDDHRVLDAFLAILIALGIPIGDFYQATA